MIESFVDLTYRGVSLGRRVKLTQVRPRTGYLEFALPMPVGTHVAIATDEGVSFDATVTWVHEQVAGLDRPAGMIIAPELAADAAAAWWQQRIALPDEERPRPTRTRPVTLRPRATSKPPPLPPDVATRGPIIADLAARVSAAAGVAPPAPHAAPPPPPPTPHELRTAVMNAVDLERLEEQTRNPDAEPTELRTGVMNALEQERLELQTRARDDERAIRPTGEHDVIDDGKSTILMESVDPVALGLEPAPPATTPAAATGDATDDAIGDAIGDTTDAVDAHRASDAGSARDASDAGSATDASSAGDAGDASDDGDDGDDGPDAGDTMTGAPSDTLPDGPSNDKPPERRGWFRRRNKRR